MHSGGLNLEKADTSCTGLLGKNCQIKTEGTKHNRAGAINAQRTVYGKGYGIFKFLL